MENSQVCICLLRPAIAFLILHTVDIKTIAEALPSTLDGADFIFIPVNNNSDVQQAEGGSHWSLVVISSEQHNAYYFDSLGISSADLGYLVSRKLAQHLDCRPYNFVKMGMHQQTNDSDCGPSICLVTKILVERILAEDYYNLTIDSLRRKDFNVNGFRKLLSSQITKLRRQCKGHRIESMEGITIMMGM